MKRNSARRIIYTRTFLAFFAIYFVLIIGFTVFLISQEKNTTGKELLSYALSVNKKVEDILKDNIDSNNQVTDIAKIRKEFAKDTSFFTNSGTEVAVFTGDYKLLLNTTDHWLCSYTEYKEGNRNYAGYGYLNLNAWFSEKEVAELENYLYQYADPGRVKKAGDFIGYTLELEGLWVDNGMIIPDKITVVVAYAKSINKDEKGNITAIMHHRENIAVYTPGYENIKDLPYFKDGFIKPRINGNYNEKKQDELRRMVTNEENLKEAILSIIPSPFYSIKSVGILTYRYYLPMPYQNSIRSIDDQNYYSDYWTVIGRDVNMWDRCSTTLIFVWISCLIIFAVAALILSKQTYKIYEEREALEKQR